MGLVLYCKYTNHNDNTNKATEMPHRHQQFQFAFAKNRRQGVKAASVSTPSQAPMRVIQAPVRHVL
jgi:hypothetical protein